MTLATEALERRSLGGRLLQRGLLVPARDEFQRWLGLVEAAADPGLVIPPLNALTAVACTHGDFEAAAGYLQRALAFCDDPAAPVLDRLRVYLNLLNVYTNMGRLAEAQAYAEKAAALGPERDPSLNKTYLLNLCKMYWRRHEWVPMRRVAEKTYEVSLAAGDQLSIAKALINRGISHLELGAHRLAERDLKSALEVTPHLDTALVAYIHAEIGRLHFLREEFGEALEEGREALNTLLSGVAAFDKEEVARVSRLFGTIFAKSGQRNLALKYLNRAAAYFSQLGLMSEWQRSTDLIGQVLSEPVRPARGQLQREVQQLDFLTAVLDQTDDLESVDPYLRGHSERIANLAVLFGEEWGLSAEELVILNHAARLADVGMIAVDAELLQREGTLSESEVRRVAMHATIGEEMVRPYGLPAGGLQAIRHHHEHFDGTGQPDGLQADEIPLLARIIAVVDVYDSLTSVRFHRGAMSHIEALAEMQAMAGHKLDPRLVDRFVTLCRV